MTTTLQIWPTTRSIFVYCGQHAALAAKYAAVPLVCLSLLHIGAIAMGVDMSRDLLWAFVADAAAILIYAPFIVTWFQSIAVGEAQARARPLLNFGKLEGRVIIVEIQIAIVTLAAGVLLALIAGVASYVVAGLAGLDWIVVGAIFGIPALFIWVFLLTQVSVALAYAAAGEPIGLISALKLSKPIAMPMTAVHLILAVSVGLPMALITIPALTFAGEASIGQQLASSAIRVASFMAYLLLVTTLYGFVYRMLKDAHPRTPSSEET